MTIQEQIDLFISNGPPYAIVGASRNREKYGNKVFRCYLQHNLAAYPINPREEMIEGEKCFPDFDTLPEKIRSVSIITPPFVTEQVIRDAIAADVKNVWLQPGAESDKAVQLAKQEEINVIYGGPCLLVVMGYKEI